MTTFVELMSDPAYMKADTEAREREAREHHERQMARGRPSAHREPSAAKPSAQDLRDSINDGRRRDEDGRVLNFEGDVRSAAHRHSRRKDQAHDRR